MELDNTYVDPLEHARQHLIANGVEFDAGLTAKEFQQIEEQFGFFFPPDLKWFLGHGVPVGDRFPNWRIRDNRLKDQVNWPLEGIVFDVANGVFWHLEWGDRPVANEHAVSLAMKMTARIPFMIPVYGHSYLPSIPCKAGNPVFSIHQADVIHRGANLAAYLLWIHHDNKDEIEGEYPVFDPAYDEIEFWTSVARRNAE